MTQIFRNLLFFTGFAVLTACPADKPDPTQAPQGSAAGETASASGGTKAPGRSGDAGKSTLMPPGGTAGKTGKPDDGADAGPSTHAGGSHAAATGGKGASVSDAGVAGSGGAPVCDLQCASGEHCELVQVQCVKAPCPPIPKCVAGMSGMPGSGNARCGSRGSLPCPDEQYCDYPADNQCGATDAGGNCKAKPQACTQQYDPVCGCDGKTYGNACSAAGAGVSVATSGECGGNTTPPAGKVSCDPRSVLCKKGTPKCKEGSVPSVVGSCYGDCVPVEECACDSADACPQRDFYTCHMSAHHCTPYL